MLQQVDELVFEEDEEEQADDGDGVDWQREEEHAEDDPVDLAMRLGEVGRMEMEYDEDGDEEDDEDEQIVYQSRSSSQLAR